jgi:hypothetical protein
MGKRSVIKESSDDHLIIIYNLKGLESQGLGGRRSIS